MRASIRAVFLYNVSDSVELAAAPKPASHAPRYLGFQTPPFPFHAETLDVQGRRVELACKAFEFGVLSTTLSIPFEGSWEELVRAAFHVLEDPSLEARARAATRTAAEAKLSTVIKNLYDEWISEDYMVIVATGDNRPAAEILAVNGDAIARLVRGELQTLSDAERQEVLGSAMSCYPTDLLVVGWAAAFVSDTAEGAESTLQLLEYANSQLLEFRHYEQRLREMLRKFDSENPKRARRRIAREAEQLNTLRLDVREIAERSDNALRLFGDMFYARAFRTIASRIGVDDYRRMLENRMETAGELYRFLVDQMNHRRAFVLEAMVVVILVVELVLFLLWKM